MENAEAMGMSKPVPFNQHRCSKSTPGLQHSHIPSSTDNQGHVPEKKLGAAAELAIYGEQTVMGDPSKGLSTAKTYLSGKIGEVQAYLKACTCKIEETEQQACNSIIDELEKLQFDLTVLRLNGEYRRFISCSDFVKSKLLVNNGTVIKLDVKTRLIALNPYYTQLSTLCSYRPTETSTDEHLKTVLKRLAELVDKTLAFNRQLFLAFSAEAKKQDVTSPYIETPLPHMHAITSRDKMIRTCVPFTFVSTELSAIAGDQHLWFKRGKQYPCAVKPGTLAWEKCMGDKPYSTIDTEGVIYTPAQLPGVNPCFSPDE